MAVRLGDFLSPNCHQCRDGKKVKCEFEVPGQEIWSFDGVDYKGCPVRQVTRASSLYLTAYQIYQDGHYPNAGGWLNQPAKMLDAFEVIRNELREMEKDKKAKT